MRRQTEEQKAARARADALRGMRRTREFLRGLTTTAKVAGAIRFTARDRLVDIETALKNLEQRP